MPKCTFLFLGIAGFFSVDAQKTIVGRLIAGRNVLVTKEDGVTISLQKLFEVAVLTITLACHLLFGKLFNTGVTD